jgi:hypothetical protein
VSNRCTPFRSSTKPRTPIIEPRLSIVGLEVEDATPATRLRTNSVVVTRVGRQASHSRRVQPSNPVSAVVSLKQQHACSSANGREANDEQGFGRKTNMAGASDGICQCRGRQSPLNDGVALLLSGPRHNHLRGVLGRREMNLFRSIGNAALQKKKARSQLIISRCKRTYQTSQLCTLMSHCLARLRTANNECMSHSTRIHKPSTENLTNPQTASGVISWKCNAHESLGIMSANFWARLSHYTTHAEQ